MGNLINCIHCEDEFDPQSKQKAKAGGKFNECPDCAEETTVKYLGLQAGDGKQAQAAILKFKSEEDRERYREFWKNNSGVNKSKSCQLGNHLSTDPGISFETIQTIENMNHKGKAT